MVTFIKRLLCGHPFLVSVQLPRGRGWVHTVQCVRCGKTW